MTVEDLKRLDKQIQCIAYPYGVNFPVMKKILRDVSRQQELSVSTVMQQYLAWKWRR